jgi:hypothetical protein
MAYKYACFISYKRPPNWLSQAGALGAPAPHVWSDFAEAFQQRLNYYLTTPVPSFLDVKLQPGTNFRETLAQNLCHSFCMVALVVPQYFESPWCNAEWNAMAASSKVA